VNQSQSIAALAAALAKAQADISGAVKDSANPFFKSKYADLESVWSACRKPLTGNGLSVIQTTQPFRQGLMLVTTLAHSSGEWIRGYMPILAKDNSAQSQGSAVTYARRYALAAIVGIYQVDDDGEAAQARHIKPDPAVLVSINSAGTVEALNEAYKTMSIEERKQHIDAFKARKAELGAK
jgi:hypothetical protein